MTVSGEWNDHILLGAVGFSLMDYLCPKLFGFFFIDISIVTLVMSDIPFKMIDIFDS